MAGFPTSGKLIIDPAGPTPEVVTYTNISLAGRYRFELSAPLVNSWPESRFVYLHPDSHGPYTPGGSVAGGYGFQPGDVIMVRGTFNPSGQFGLNFCNQLPSSGSRVTYRADATGAKVYATVTSWYVLLGFVGARSLAFEGIEFYKNRNDGSDGILRADRYVGSNPRIEGTDNILFQNCRFRLSRRLAWAAMPKADWIGNSFYDFADGVGAVMAHPGYRVANNLFHNMTLTHGTSPVVRASGAAGNPATVENNTFHSLGTTNANFALQADNTNVVVQNNIFDRISGTGVRAPAGTPVDYNLFYACTVNYGGGTAGGSHDITGRDPLFVSTNITRRTTSPFDLITLPDLHELSPYGYTTNNANGVYLRNYSGPISPVVDAGNPASDWSNETYYHGKRINIGAYGNTPESALSPLPPGTLLLIR